MGQLTTSKFLQTFVLCIHVPELGDYYGGIPIVGFFEGRWRQRAIPVDEECDSQTAAV
jgi:hypothetical protein